MKLSTKLIILFSVICCVLLVAAFTILPRAQITSGNRHGVEISILDASVNEDKLTLSVNYMNYGGQFEIAKDIGVATDSSLSTKLRALNCNVEKETGIYTYEFALNSKTETFYIEPPVLYVLSAFDSVSAALDIGSTIYTTEGDEWFTVSSVNINDISDGMYSVTVVITPHTDRLPRLPKLVFGGNKIGCMSSLNFNQDGIFDYGIFVFYMPAVSEEVVVSLLDTAMIELDQALDIVPAADMQLSSNVNSLLVVD